MPKTIRSQVYQVKEEFEILAIPTSTGKLLDLDLEDDIDPGLFEEEPRKDKPVIYLLRESRNWLLSIRELDDIFTDTEAEDEDLLSDEPIPRRRI